jgi:hypothetical protein
MKARFLLALVAVALAASTVLPTASAQGVGIQNPNVSTPTTLYFHINGFQDFAINTQKPIDKYADSVSVGTATHTTSCIPNPGVGVNLSQEYHTEYGYSSPSYVEYDFEENGKPRTHPERGISYDAKIDTGAPFTLYWYLQTMAGVNSVGAADPDAVPVVIPNVVVRATIRAGDSISVDDIAYNSGPLLAEGTTTAATLVSNPVGSQAVDSNGGAHPQVTAYNVNGKYLYEFRVPITVQSPIIPRNTGYNLRIDTYMDNPACGYEQGMLMPNLVRVHTSAEYRPRMELAIMNPIRLEYLHPQFVGDDLVIHTSMNAAWGNYDVNEQDPDGIQISITGPSPATSLAKAAIVQRTHEHYHHQEAVDITYVWPYKTDRAANGLYTVEVKFLNDQRTASASGTAQFEIGKGLVIGCGGVQESSKAVGTDCGAQVQKDGVAQKESPGLELLAIVGILGAAVALVRRRQA